MYYNDKDADSILTDPVITGGTADDIDIGLVTPARAYFEELKIINNAWFSGDTYAGTDVVNILKITETDEIECGGTLSISGALEFAEDTGAATRTNMPVSNASAAGLEMSYTDKIDGNNILTFYAESDGSGGIQNPSVRPNAPTIHIQTPQVRTGAGVVDITSAITHIVTTAADALTLADGVEGQEKYIIMKTDSGDGTLTPTSYSNGTTITFAAVGESAHLLFTNGSWHWMGGSATSA